jgi:hypothetical protein
MSERVNAFASLKDPPVFEVKPKTEKPVARAAVDRLADDNNFPSRQARKTSATPARKPRLYRTGRNRHFGIKTTDATIERYYRMADERNVSLCVLLELALDALEKNNGPGAGDTGA